MQVHNEGIAKVTIFKQLISITTYLISVFGGQLGGLGGRTQRVPLYRQYSQLYYNYYSLDEIITRGTCCLHYTVPDKTPHISADHYAKRKVSFKHYVIVGFLLSK